MSTQPKVFISHSFDNKAGFYNVADALERESVPFWNPDEVKSASSLRDQLRRAVMDCSVCVFVATRAALESSWCGAELGAFWAVGKPIIVFAADSTLKEEDLPGVVKGDVWEGRLKNVVVRARELVQEAEAQGADPDSSMVGNLTRKELKQYIEAAIMSQAAASKSAGGIPSAEEVGRAAKGTADNVIDGIDASTRRRGATEDWRNHILWVDDNPDNNIYERWSFEAVGLKFTLALSTQEALDILSQKKFGAIISDMGRREGPREGYVLLDAMRGRGDLTPFFIYAGSRSAAHTLETEKHGGQGVTNRPQELFEMVLRGLSSSENSPLQE
jgi:CheY-like chemotaxis protein